MPRFVVFFCLFCTAGSVRAQTFADALFIEYGYPNIPKDSVTIRMMYGDSKFRVYGDDKYVQVEAYQDLPKEQLEALGAGLRSVFIVERTSGDVYICVALDSLRIRMKGGDKEKASYRQMTEAFNSGAANMYGQGPGKRDILGYRCQEFLTSGQMSDTISIYLNQDIALGEQVGDFPTWVSIAGKNYGLILGRDETLWNNYVLEFRALQVEINRPRDVAAQLASYQLVTEEEGDRLIGEWFSKLMEAPVEGRN